jgi:flagellar biogenesis protein FliO
MADSMDTFRQMLAILGVTLLLGGTLWWFKRKGLAQFSVGKRGKRRTRSMEVVERLPLSPQHSLQLVRVAERVFLVALSPSACTMVESASWDEMKERIRAGADRGVTE